METMTCTNCGVTLTITLTSTYMDAMHSDQDSASRYYRRAYDMDGGCSNCGDSQVSVPAK